MKVIIYVEGGGEKKDAKDLKSKCRKGFQKFFEKAGLAKQMPAIVAVARFQYATTTRTAALYQQVCEQTDPVTDPAHQHNHLRWVYLHAQFYEWTRGQYRYE